MIKSKQAIIALFILMRTLSAYAQDTVFLDKPKNRPYLIVFSSKRKDTRTAIIICSGGSYGRTADIEEGLPAAKLLAAKGISAFLLDYRFPKGQDSIPLADAQTAIAYVRAHARRYHVQANEVGIMGFSAGGHLVSTIGTHFQTRYDNTIKAANLRPDFMVLIYPVISMADSLTHTGSRRNFLGNPPTKEQVIEFSNELQVTADTPPAFVVAAVDDQIVKVANSLYFSAALRQHKVKTELFLYVKGGHGFGINNRTATVQWTDEALPWIINKQWKKR
ncbi:alpha/beta hydrolase [Mucilaginibacter sp. X4EP1]|uniref:alpha/beta hydrolase n=1 Tax=Mucilaginibacter sp. X4EP1 TaxID=2723092 RepID=UPI00216A3442|nr:alpha/beta hydrolase [Mucilaginibacter sp. X4EP1]MCS3815491.1 acetyl esterase/lipase [Mucilaginibacter sp. X4EP1]